ncbi:BSD domain-containing protein [Cryptosporidium andersoni]|uniref:BSD domain-containing protein n=1 Tax=Cryptosporidium andersoni TaxID=117008 RepID=A0A1J4MT69_9CRYT|nr:BSD domain-containing protein [Cryptosporidium andersoni]
MKDFDETLQDHVFPWFHIVQWASEDLPINTVLKWNYKTIKKKVEELTIDTNEFLKNCQSYKIDNFSLDDDQTPYAEWAAALLVLIPSLSNIRYELVPRRMNENLFWQRYFSTIRSIIISDVIFSTEDVNDNDTKINNTSLCNTDLYNKDIGYGKDNILPDHANDTNGRASTYNTGESELRKSNNIMSNIGGNEEHCCNYSQDINILKEMSLDTEKVDIKDTFLHSNDEETRTLDNLPVIQSDNVIIEPIYGTDILCSENIEDKVNTYETTNQDHNNTLEIDKSLYIDSISEGKYEMVGNVENRHGFEDSIQHKEVNNEVQITSEVIDENLDKQKFKCMGSFNIETETKHINTNEELMTLNKHNQYHIHNNQEPYLCTKQPNIEYNDNYSSNFSQVLLYSKLSNSLSINKELEKEQSHLEDVLHDINESNWDNNDIDKINTEDKGINKDFVSNNIDIVTDTKTSYPLVLSATRKNIYMDEINLLSIQNNVKSTDNKELINSNSQMTNLNNDLDHTDITNQDLTYLNDLEVIYKNETEIMSDNQSTDNWNYDLNSKSIQENEFSRALSNDTIHDLVQSKDHMEDLQQIHGNITL